MSLDRKEIRELVFRAIVKHKDDHPKAAEVLNQIGFFTAMDFLDAVTDAVIEVTPQKTSEVRDDAQAKHNT